MNTESVLSLRTFTKFSVFFPLVKVFFSFWVLYYFHCISLYFDLQLHAVVHVCKRESFHDHDGPGENQCLCSVSTGVPELGLYRLAEQKGVWCIVLYYVYSFFYIVTCLP